MMNISQPVLRLIRPSGNWPTSGLQPPEGHGPGTNTLGPLGIPDPQKLGEVTVWCCFKTLSFGVTSYAAIGN